MALDPLVTLDELFEFLGEPDDFDPVQAAVVLDVASATIRGFVRQTISLVEDDEATLRAEAGYELWLPERPVVAVASVTIEGVAVPAPSYRLGSSGRIRFASCLSTWGGCSSLGRDAVVVYSHGYAEIPDDIKGVGLDLAKRGIATPDTGSVVQETIGSYSVSYSRQAASALTADDERKLIGYRPPITGVPILTGS